MLLEELWAIEPWRELLNVSQEIDFQLFFQGLNHE